MIKSMTGFGRGEANDGKRNITVEIKTVNHRYSDITVKMPRRYSFIEDKVKKAIKENVKRGKVDVSIMVENITESDVNISMNKMVAAQYIENLNELKRDFNVEGDIDLKLLAGLPEVMRQVPDVEDEEEMTRCILAPGKRGGGESGKDEGRGRREAGCGSAHESRPYKGSGIQDRGKI
jgi:uncharacterized protein (TIGR00255 family)